jgi:2-keto-4-pentenoate hydratase
MITLAPRRILEHYDTGTRWPESEAIDLGTGYERALAVRALRIARGEVPRGYKVGFTNRNIWPRYQVFAPVWGTVWDTTLEYCEGQGVVPLERACQPRLEPEAVFGMRATPPADPSLDDLLDCVEWVAPGFELVQSHRPDWIFSAGDTAADGALHARLLVGRKVPVREVAASAAEFDARLAGTRVRLSRDGTPVEEGVGSNVLDGPLRALAHFVRALREGAGAADLRGGDVVSTGTWTDAWPVRPGERWVAEFAAPLSRLEARMG